MLLLLATAFGICFVVWIISLILAFISIFFTGGENNLISEFFASVSLVCLFGCGISLAVFLGIIVVEAVLQSWQ